MFHACISGKIVEIVQVPYLLVLLTVFYYHRWGIVSNYLNSITPPQSSTVNISSIETPKTFAIFHASTNEGLYFPFSRLPIVSRRTQTLEASSSCFMSKRTRYSFILFLIIICPFSFFPFQNNKCKSKCKDCNCKTQSKGHRDSFSSIVNIGTYKHKRNKRNHF